MSRPRFTHARRCQIAAWRHTADDPDPPFCGKPATWFSDDLTEGTAVWMCDEHQEQIARDFDTAEFGQEHAK